MTHQLPTIRRATVTRVTTLERAVCTNVWHFNGFPDWTLPRTLWCPWCGTEQVYPAEKFNTEYFEQLEKIKSNQKEIEEELRAMNESSLTTERDRELFKIRVQTFIDLHLATAPREQLESIEREMLRYRPTADHRK